MSDSAQRRLMVLPGAIERDDGGVLTPDLALRRLLASHLHAPRLLSEARHRLAVAGDSALAASRVVRSARDRELAYELALHKADARGERYIHFWAAAVCLGFLLTICGAAALLLTWGLPGPERGTLAIASAIIGGAMAWRMSSRLVHTGLSAGFLLVGAGLCAALMGIRAIMTTGPLDLRLGVAFALGLLLAGSVVAAVFLLRHAESRQCSRLRQVMSHAARDRQDALTQVSLDDSAARSALAAWESLVAEECQLAHPGPAVSVEWLAECVAAARRLAGAENKNMNQV